ncbi:hypothetical protein Taro_047547, partial [Colocasia esculenta]|nr:hypothetical protein [Colocasia esculenta]
LHHATTFPRTIQQRHAFYDPPSTLQYLLEALETRGQQAGARENENRVGNLPLGDPITCRILRLASTPLPPRTTATLNVHSHCRQDHAINDHIPGRQQVNDHPWPPTPTELQQPCSFPHSLLSSSPTFTLEPLHEFRWSTGARGAAVVRVVAANQAGNDEFERGVRGAFLGFQRDSRFFGSSIAFLRFCSEDLDINIGLRRVLHWEINGYTGLLSVVVWRLFRNASIVGYPRFFVSQARVFLVFGVLSRYLCCTVEVCVVFLDTLTPVFELYVQLRERRQLGSGLCCCLTCSRGAAVGPFVCDCEAERLFLCCVVRSRFDSFEVCPGVGTIMTVVVACGVPEWWHSFGYCWYLYPVWVMVCGGMSYTNLSGVDVELCLMEVVWVERTSSWSAVLYPCVWGSPVKLIA